jgi:hypothetical protein
VKKKMPKAQIRRAAPERSYKIGLLQRLQNDPEYAAEYLSASKAHSNEVFQLALQDVTEAAKPSRDR